MRLAKGVLSILIASLLSIGRAEPADEQPRTNQQPVTTSAVVTGEAINAAIPRERLPPKLDGPAAIPAYLAKLMEKVRTMDIRSFPVSIEGEDIFVEV